MDSNTFDWREKNKSMKEKIKYIFTTALFANLKIKVTNGEEKKEFMAHRLLLSIASPFFERKFDGFDERVLDYEIEDVSPSIFQLILEFSYLERIDLTNFVQGCDLYRLAHKFEITSVQNFCLHYLKKHIDFDNVILGYQLSVDYNLPDFKKLCKDFISTNASKVLPHPNFLQVKQSIMKEIMEECALKTDYTTPRPFTLPLAKDIAKPTKDFQVPTMEFATPTKDISSPTKDFLRPLRPKSLVNTSTSPMKEYGKLEDKPVNDGGYTNKFATPVKHSSSPTKDYGRPPRPTSFTATSPMKEYGKWEDKPVNDEDIRKVLAKVLTTSMNNFVSNKKRESSLNEIEEGATSVKDSLEYYSQLSPDVGNRTYRQKSVEKTQPEEIKNKFGSLSKGGKCSFVLELTDSIPKDTSTLYGRKFYCIDFKVNQDITLSALKLSTREAETIGERGSMYEEFVEVWVTEMGKDLEVHGQCTTKVFYSSTVQIDLKNRMPIINNKKYRIGMWFVGGKYKCIQLDNLERSCHGVTFSFIRAADAHTTTVLPLLSLHFKHGPTAFR